MSEQKLLPLFDSVYLVALATWIGSLAFWLFGVSPVLRRRLAGEELDRAERELAQRSCLWGTVAGGLALGSLVYGSLSTPELRGPLVGGAATLIIVAVLALLYVANGVLPKLAKATAETSGHPAVGVRLRQTIQTLMILALVIGLGLLAAHAFRDTLRPREPDRSRSIEEYRRAYYGNVRKSQEFWEQYRRDDPNNLLRKQTEPSVAEAAADPRSLEAAR